MQCFNDFRGKRLSDLGGILPQQLLHLSQREVRQVEFLLDIKRRNSPVVIQLRNVLHTDDANAIRATHRDIGDIDMPERMKKPLHGFRRDAIKFVYQEDNPILGEMLSQCLKEVKHLHPVGYLRVREKLRERRRQRDAPCAKA